MKQYFIIFLISFLCLFFLGTGIFGVNGFFYNQDLKRQIAEAEYNRDKLEVDINSLREQKTHLSSDEGLRELAIDLGYYVDGDTVYLFDEPSLQDSEPSVESTSTQAHYKPISSASILLIDLGASIVITFIIWLFSKDKKSKDYFDGEDDITDMDIYINA